MFSAFLRAIAMHLNLKASLPVFPGPVSSIFGKCSPVHLQLSLPLNGVINSPVHLSVFLKFYDDNVEDAPLESFCVQDCGQLSFAAVHSHIWLHIYSCSYGFDTSICYLRTKSQFISKNYTRGILFL